MHNIQTAPHMAPQCIIYMASQCISLLLQLCTGGLHFRWWLSWSFSHCWCNIIPSGFLTGGYVLRLFHGHMDECLAIPAAEQGDNQRRWWKLLNYSTFNQIPYHLSLTAHLCFSELLTMKGVLSVAMPGHYGDWNPSGLGERMPLCPSALSNINHSHFLRVLSLGL